MERPIDDILNDIPEPVATEEVTQEVAEPEAKAERERDEHGRFKSKEETGVETPPAPEAVAEPVPPTEQANQLPPQEFAALKDERRKRQALEDEVRQMREQFTRMQPVQPQQPPPDFWDDPTAFMSHMRKEMRVELLQSLREEQQTEKINASEQAAIAKYPDYPDAFNAFQQAVQLNPRLAEEMVRAPDPAEFAYSKGKAALAIEQYGSIDALLAAERQKWENEARSAFPTTQKPALPSTTAADGSVAARGNPAYAGSPSIDDILKR